jgi:hypothetical protein
MSQKKIDKGNTDSFVDGVSQKVHRVS